MGIYQIEAIHYRVHCILLATGQGKLHVYMTMSHVIDWPP